MSQPEILISRKAAAERAKVHPRTIDMWRSTGKIKTYRDGRKRIWLDPEEIDKMGTVQIVPVQQGAAE